MRTASSTGCAVSWPSRRRANRDRQTSGATLRSSPPCQETVGSSSPRCSQRDGKPSSDETITPWGLFVALLLSPSVPEKSCIVTRRLACNPRLQNALYHWARVAVQHDPRSRAKYAALRLRGHGHAPALRSVGDRLLNVACAMLRNGTQFNPSLESQKMLPKR